MSDYTLDFTTSAAREFRSLPRAIQRRVETVVESLPQTPRPSGVRKLRGANELYRVRIGSYRLVYEIDDQASRILVTRVGHRRDAYR